MALLSRPELLSVAPPKERQHWIADYESRQPMVAVSGLRSVNGPM